MQLGTPTEADDLDALLAAIEAADGRAALTEYKMMRRGDYDDAPAVAARIDDVTIGYAQVARHPGGGADSSAHWAIEIAVDPAQRIPAIYDALIAAATTLVPAGERVAVWAWHGELEAALMRAGYAPTRLLHRLECPLPIAATAAGAPGTAVRAFEVGHDEAAWLSVNNAAFAGHPENGALTMNDLEERLRRPWFNPADLLMAWEGPDLIGSCWTKHHADGVGEIYIIGVSPDAQGRGLGRDLVIRGLDHLFRSGSRTGMLYVDGANEAAMWLYTDLGFRSVWTNRQYELVEGERSA